MDTMILRIMREIDCAPFSDWGLEQTAAMAGYSPFHFHRLFKATTGTTLYRFVRSRQMQTAARRVILQERLEDVAEELNYSSSGSFSRSFKNFVGVSPTEFRVNPITASTEMYAGIYDLEVIGDYAMQSKTIVLDRPIAVVGVQVQTNPPNDMNISVAWKGLSKHWSKIVDRGANPRTFGMEEYVGNSRQRLSGILYTACVECSDAVEAPAGTVRRTIPAGRYAVFTHVGSTETLDRSFRHIYTAGLAQLGVTAQGEFDLEVYDDRYKEGDPNSALDIYVPIAA